MQRHSSTDDAWPDGVWSDRQRHAATTIGIGGGFVGVVMGWAVTTTTGWVGALILALLMFAWYVVRVLQLRASRPHPPCMAESAGLFCARPRGHEDRRHDYVSMATIQERHGA